MKYIGNCIILYRHLFIFDKVNGWASLARPVGGAHLFQVFGSNYYGHEQKNILINFFTSLKYANVVHDTELLMMS